MPKLLHWGYTLDHPTAWSVTKYLGFSFGFKWLLIALALLFASKLQRRVFVAVSSLLLIAFCFRIHDRSSGKPEVFSYLDYHRQSVCCFWTLAFMAFITGGNHTTWKVSRDSSLYLNYSGWFD